jgi:hypothetical protein
VSRAEAVEVEFGKCMSEWRKVAERDDLERKEQGFA